MNILMETEIKQDNDEIHLARQAVTDIEAFAELYRRHVTSVYRYQIAHTGNVKDAEDLTSQTFMAALEGIRSFRGAGSFAGWLMGIAARKRLMFFRKNGNRLEVPLDTARDHPSLDPPTDKAAQQRLLLESVSRAMKQLAPDRAEAIILTFFSGLSNAEAGRLLHKSEDAVKMLISRGLQDLRERTSLVLEVER